MLLEATDSNRQTAVSHSSDCQVVWHGDALKPVDTSRAGVLCIKTSLLISRRSLPSQVTAKSSSIAPTGHQLICYSFIGRVSTWRTRERTLSGRLYCKGLFSGAQTSGGHFVDPGNWKANSTSTRQGELYHITGSRQKSFTTFIPEYRITQFYFPPRLSTVKCIRVLQQQAQSLGVPLVYLRFCSS
jgi:hypothetical protein